MTSKEKLDAYLNTNVCKDGNTEDKAAFALAAMDLFADFMSKQGRPIMNKDKDKFILVKVSIPSTEFFDTLKSFNKAENRITETQTMV